MGFGLPSALGAAAAFDGKNGRPKRTVVDIDGDGSFLMNVQVRSGADCCRWALAVQVQQRINSWFCLSSMPGLPLALHQACAC
jgi:TPP-dependent 2-oxoacid decarboxylase